MPRRRRRSKFVTRRAFPFLLMKQLETKSESTTAKDVSFLSTLPIDVGVNEISQGTMVSERVGMEVQTSSVFFKCSFSNSLDDSNPTNKAYYARVVLYTPRDSADLIDIQPMEFPDRQKFIIWADKTVGIPWTNNLSHSIITIKKKFKPYMKTIYDGSSSGSAIKGKLMIAIVTDSDSNLVECSYMARTYYKDA